MKNFGARTAILLVFGAVCALALAFVLNPNSTDNIAEPTTSTESNRIEPSKNDAREPARTAQNSIQSTVGVGQSESRAPEPGNKESATLQDLFSSIESDERDSIDDREVAILLRDHIDANHPELKLSDEDLGRLTDLIRKVREAKAKMNSMERVGANSAALSAALQDVNSATESFTEIVGMSPGEFFMTEDAPVSFGNDGRADGDNEIVTEYLSDYKP